MCREKLCPKCKTGKETYDLDNTSVCPYLPLHNGKECAMFVPLDEYTDTFPSFKI